MATTTPRDRHIPDLVSLTEAAEILDISRAALHKMATKGQILGAQAGTTWVFRRVVVEREHVERQGKSPATAPRLLDEP